MSLAGLGIKSGPRNVCLLIASTGQQGQVLYKGDKGVNVAARPLEGGLAEAGGLSASNLPLISIPHPARMPDDSAKARWIELLMLDDNNRNLNYVQTTD